MPGTRLPMNNEDFAVAYNRAKNLESLLTKCGLEDTPENRRKVRSKANMMRKKYSIPLRYFPGAKHRVDWDAVRKAAQESLSNGETPTRKKAKE